MNNPKLQNRDNPEGRFREVAPQGGTLCQLRGVLRDSRQRIEAAFLASPLAIITLDRQGIVLSWNLAAERMLGWSREEVLGNPLPAVPQDEEVRYRTQQELVVRGEPLSLNVSPRKKDGSRFPAILSIVPLFDEAGQMNGSLHIFQTIAQTIAGGERDSRIKPGNMEAIGQLARGLAHEFNNSVGAILGWAEMALDGLDPQSPLRKPLDQILNQARHACAVTRDLVAFSQRQALEMDDVDLNHVVERALGLSGRLLPPGVVVKKAFAPNLPHILADSEQIERALLDLCLYAQDAMPGKGALRVETQPVRIDEDQWRQTAGATPGNYALLCVSCNVQTDPETLRHILEPFFLMPQDGRARGLGLAAAYGIVRQHGGFIRVSSEPDFGTRFEVFLPLIASESEPLRGTPTRSLPPY
jgi:PAS domain S-box-containing protein